MIIDLIHLLLILNLISIWRIYTIRDYISVRIHDWEERIAKGKQEKETRIRIHLS